MKHCLVILLLMLLGCSVQSVTEPYKPAIPVYDGRRIEVIDSVIDIWESRDDVYPIPLPENCYTDLIETQYAEVPEWDLQFFCHKPDVQLLGCFTYIRDFNAILLLEESTPIQKERTLKHEILHLFFWCTNSNRLGITSDKDHTHPIWKDTGLL